MNNPEVPPIKMEDTALSQIIDAINKNGNPVLGKEGLPLISIVYISRFNEDGTAVIGRLGVPISSRTEDNICREITKFYVKFLTKIEVTP